MSFAVDTNVLLHSIDDGHVAQQIAQDGLFTLRDRGEILSVFPQNLINDSDFKRFPEITVLNPRSLLAETQS